MTDIMADLKFDPFNPTHVDNWRAWDDYHRKVSDIKIIPASPDDIQFRIPYIRTVPWVAKGIIYALPPRRPDEMDEHYGARCVKIENIGEGTG